MYIRIYTIAGQVQGKSTVHTYIYSNTYTEKVPGVSVEDGVEQAVVQVAVLLRPVVVEVDKVLQVVVRSEVVHLLLLSQDSHTHHLTQTGGHQGMEGCGTLGRVCGIHMQESKVNYNVHTYIQVRQNNIRLLSSLLCFSLPSPHLCQRVSSSREVMLHVSEHPLPTTCAGY